MLHFKNPITLFFALFLFLLPTQGQNVLKGKVYDESGKPLYSATIYAYKDSTFKAMANYAMSNKAGEWKISTNAQPPLWLRVKMLGYEEWSQQVDSISDNINIYLYHSSLSLSEVVVKGKYSGVKVVGDTIQFDTNHFKNGTETNIGEILRKLPGVNVSESGKVSYSGKEVSKLLVNGNDLFQKENSGTVINNLDASAMTGAEIIRNYKGDDLNDKYSTKEKLALNIKTDKSIKLSGNMGAEGGIKNKYMGKATLISFNKELSGTLLTSSSNKGMALISFDDYTTHISPMKEEEDGSLTFSVSGAEGNLLYPSEYIDTNKGSLISVGTKYKPNKKFEMQGSLLYSDNSTHEKQYSEDTYFDQNKVVEQISETDINTRFMAAKLKQNWKPSERFQLEAQTAISGVSVNNLNQLSNTGGEDALVNNAIQNKALKVSQELSSKLETKYGFFYAHLLLGYNDKKKHSFINTDKPLLPFSYDHSTAMKYPYTLETDYKTQSFSFNGDLSYKRILSKNYLLKSTLSYELANEKQKFLWAYADEKDQFNTRCYQLENLFRKHEGLLRFTLAANLAKQEIHNPYRNKTYKTFNIIPWGDITLQFGMLHSLNLRLEHNVEPIENWYLVNYQHVLRYNELYIGTQINSPFKKSYRANLTHSLFSLGNNRTITSNLSFTKSKGEPTSIIHTNSRYITQSFATTGYTTSLHAFTTYSEDLGFIPFNIYIVFNGSYTKSPTSVNNADRYSTFKSFNETIGLKSRFKSAFNFSLEGNLSQSYSHIDDLNIKNQLHNWSVEGGLYYSKNKFKGTFKMGYTSLNNILYKDYHINLSGKMSYKIGKIVIEMNAHNLLNLTKYEMANVSTSAYYSSRSVYNKIPGYITLGAKWQF